MADYSELINLEKKKKEPASSALVSQKVNPTQETPPDTVIPRYHDTKHDTTTPINHDTMLSKKREDIFEIVRKAVKQVGKEAATHRFTQEEKQALADIEYTYQRQGMRTSENELTRIAINYVVEEYGQHGEQSILAKALKKLYSWYHETMVPSMIPRYHETLLPWNHGAI